MFSTYFLTHHKLIIIFILMKHEIYIKKKIIYINIIFFEILFNLLYNTVIANIHSLLIIIINKLSSIFFFRFFMFSLFKVKL